MSALKAKIVDSGCSSTQGKLHSWILGKGGVGREGKARMGTGKREKIGEILGLRDYFSCTSCESMVSCPWKYLHLQEVSRYKENRI